MTNPLEELVIVGGGMATGRLLTRLMGLGVRQRITVVSAEAARPYNRVLLPDLLAGSCREQSLALHPDSWYAENGIRFLGAREVVAIDLAARRVRLAGGERLPYDRLVLATGAGVPLPDIPGVRLPGVTTLRSLADTYTLRRLAAGGLDITVVGGGLLGLEAACSLATLGCRVRVVQRPARLLNRQLDDTAADMVRAFLEQRGIECLVAESLEAIEGSGRVAGIRLRSGQRIDASAVLFATGTEPHDGLARDAGIHTRQGILTGPGLETSAADVFAIGECARVDGATHAMVEPVFRQADVLARRLAGHAATFTPLPPATRLKIPDLPVFSAGAMEPDPGPDDFVIRDPANRVYRRLHFRGNRLVGAVLIGDATGARAIQSCLAAGGAVDDPLPLAFGLAEAAA